MTTNSTAQKEPLTGLPAWKALSQHHQKIRNLHLRQLFADDPQRGERLSADAAGLFLDINGRKRPGRHQMTVEEAVQVWRNEGDPN